MSPLIRSVSVICGCLPFGVIMMAIATLHREGHRFWLSPIFLVCFVVTLVLAFAWFRHVVTVAAGVRLRLLVSIFSLSVAGAAIQTDWVVDTQYDHMGHVSYQTFTPPRTPLWQPPEPGKVASGAKSWRDYRFFLSGGFGGPVEEPRLAVNWLFVLTRVFAFTLVPYAVISGLMILREHGAISRQPGGSAAPPQCQDA